MTNETLLLPIAVGLSVLGLVGTVVVWRTRRFSRGRVLQGLAWTLLPVGLYLTGLLRLALEGLVTLARWASALTLSVGVSVGLGLLGLGVVLLVVGGLLVRRSHRRGAASTGAGEAGAGKAGDEDGSRRRGRRSGAPAVGAGADSRSGRGEQSPPAEDDEMAEIEALLKSRGIS